MAEGIVKWFNESKGIGFIEPDGGGADVFVHFSAIAMDGFKTVRPGARVRYDQMDGPKGVFALNIQALAEPAKRQVAAPQEVQQSVQSPDFAHSGPMPIDAFAALSGQHSTAVGSDTFHR